jgi:hypothetical protein
LNIQTILKQRNGHISSKGNFQPSATSTSSWMRCFSQEHAEYFYYNSESGESRWDPPEGVTDIPDDPSLSSHPSNSRTAADESVAVSAKTSSETATPNLSALKLDSLTSGTQAQISTAKGTALSTYPDVPQLQGQGQQISSSSSLLRAAFGSDNTETAMTPAVAIADPVPAVAVAVGLLHSEQDTTTYATRRFDSMDDAAMRRSSVTSVSTIESMDSMGLGADDIDEEVMPDPDMVRRLTEMGFQSEAVVKALRFTENNITAAASYLLANRSSSRSRPPPSTAPPRRNGSTTSDLLRRLGMPAATNASAPPPPPPYNEHFR